MNWREMRKVVQEKLNAEKQECQKHDFWHIKRGDKYVGKIKDSHGSGQMTPPEIGGCARSLGASEYDFKQLVGCTLSGPDYFTKYVDPPVPADPPPPGKPTR